MTELPDAPWVTAENELPDAPWAMPPPVPMIGGLAASALDIPGIGPISRKINAAITAGIAPFVDQAALPEPTFGERYASALKKMEQPLDQFRQEHPIASTAANIAGTIPAAIALGGTPLMGMASGPLWAQMGTQALSGAGISAGDALLRGENPVQAAISGGAIGAAFPLGSSALRRAITPLPATPAHTAEAAVLRGEGVPLTAGASTGSRPLQWAENALGDVPGAGGATARATERQAEGFTAAALRPAGITANRATPDVIDRAFTRIGNDFEAVGRRNVVNYDPALGTDLIGVRAEYENLVGPGSRAPIVNNMVRDIQQDIIKNGGHLTGDQYNAVTSRLAKLGRGAQSDPQLQDALYGIRSALDDAFERSLRVGGNVGDLALLQQARNQYRNMMVIERAATGPGSDTAKHLISPSQLRNATVALHGRRAFARGFGDFQALANAGEAVLKPLPQSGTAPRAYAMAIPHTIGAVGFGMGEPISALGGLLGPALAGRALMSRPIQGYLGNQLLHGRGPIMSDLTRSLGAAFATTPYFPSGP